jgi:hypothetical protein
LQEQDETDGSNMFEDAEERIDGGDPAMPVKTSKSKEKNSKKGKRKGENGTESQEFGSQDALGDVEEVNGSQHRPPSRTFAEALDDALEVHIDENQDYEVVVGELPNAKRNKKANGTHTEKGERAGVTADPEEATFEDDEGDEAANLLNAARTSSKAPKMTRSKKSRRVAAEPEVTPEPKNLEEGGGAGHIVEDSALLPQKMKNARKKLKDSARKSLVQSITVDNNDSGAILHQPLTFAHNGYWNQQNSQEDNIGAEAQLQKDAQAVSPLEGVEDDGTPVRLSKKALGKRKAVDEPIAEKPKKKKAKRGKDTKPQGRDIRTYVSLTPSNGVSKTIFEMDRDESLPELAQRTYLEMESEESVHNAPPSPAIPVKVSRSSNIVAKKPILLPTNSFIPINQRRQSAPDSESSFDPAPTSNERCKPPLPTDEDESSSVKSKKKTSVKSQAKTKTPKTPNSGSKTPRAHATSVSKGRVSKDDMELISDAVEAYRELHDLTEFEINELIHKDANSQGALWEHLCAEVPDMPRRSVQNTCRRKFHNLNRGPFTQEDDEELKFLHQKYPGKWKQIGEEMNRFPEDARDRWRNYLVCGDNMRKDVWDKEEEEKLKRVVLEYVDYRRKMDRHDNDPRTALANDNALIDWPTISKNMNHTRSRLQCANKWRKIKAREESDVADPAAVAPISRSTDTWRLEDAQKFVSGMNAADKLNLLYALRDSRAGTENSIPWRRITVEELNTKGKRMAWKLCFRLLKEKIPNHDEMKLQEIVELLIDAFELAAPDEPAAFRFSKTSLTTIKQKSSPSRQNKTELSEQYISGEDDDSGKGSSIITRPKQTRRSSNVFAGEPLDNGDGSSTKRTKKSKEKTEVNEDVLSDDNAESSAPKKKRKVRKQKKQDESREAMDQDRVENAPEKPSTTKKKKFRNRMKMQDQSQETVEDRESYLEAVPSSDDIERSFQALKTPKAKNKTRTIRKSKRNKSLSEEKIVEEDNEESYQALVNGDTLHLEEDVIDLEGDEDSPSAGGPETKQALEDEEEHYSQSQHYDHDDHTFTSNDGFEEEDCDDDDEHSDHHITTNGFHNENEYEDVDEGEDEGINTYHNRLSVDLDTPAQDFKRSTSNRFGSPFSMDRQPLWDEFGQSEGSRSVSSDDEMEDIPAILPPKKGRMESVDLDA